MLRIEIDGRRVDVAVSRVLPFGGYGHFTAMQVRGRRTRGLELHLKRLDANTAELFGRRLDGDRVRDHIRHALGDDITDASVRVHVAAAEPGKDQTRGADEVAIMVTVRPPAEMSGTPLGLKAVRYQRPLAHVKHSGGFAQDYYRRLAHRDGFDEALLTDTDGVISEGGITNVGFVAAGSAVWPDAPALPGITMQLLELGLAERGVPQTRRTVRVSDADRFDGAFVTNSQGIAAVDRIDERSMPVAVGFMKTLTDIYESVPWDPI